MYDFITRKLMSYIFKPTEVDGKMHMEPMNTICEYVGKFDDLNMLKELLGDKARILIRDIDGLYWWFYTL